MYLLYNKSFATVSEHPNIMVREAAECCSGLIDRIITCYLECVEGFLALLESWNSVSNRLSAAMALDRLSGDQKPGSNIVCLLR